MTSVRAGEPTRRSRSRPGRVNPIVGKRGHGPDSDWLARVGRVADPLLVQDIPSSQNARDYDGSRAQPVATGAAKVPLTVAATRPAVACTLQTVHGGVDQDGRDGAESQAISRWHRRARTASHGQGRRPTFASPTHRAEQSGRGVHSPLYPPWAPSSRPATSRRCNCRCRADGYRAYVDAP
jgi:hypothetical protein